MNILDFLKSKGYSRNILKGENGSICLYVEGFMDKPHDCYRTLFECIQNKAKKESSCHSLSFRTVKKLNKMNIQIDTDVMHWESGLAEPYYRIQCKPISKAHICDILLRMSMLNEKSDESNWSDINNMMAVDKSPNVNKLIQEAFNLAYDFDFLDLIIVITNTEKEKTAPDKNLIAENIEIGVQIKNGNINILNGRRAYEVYESYSIDKK